MPNIICPACTPRAIFYFMVSLYKSEVVVLVILDPILGCDLQTCGAGQDGDEKVSCDPMKLGYPDRYLAKIRAL